MLRSILIYLSKANWMKRMVMGWGVARKVALRFVAGEKLEDAIRVVGNLNEKGMNATLDQLGEDTNTPDEARQTGEEILRILDAIHESGVRASLSLKLTQIGLALDENLCGEILADILDHARVQGNFVRIDMEDSDCVDATIRVYKKVRDLGFRNVGMVMQSYLYRAEEDTKALLEMETPIRLVKGAYKEPAEIAFPKKSDVDENYDHLMTLLLDASSDGNAPAISDDGKWPPIPAAGTHDADRVIFVKKYADEIELPKEKLEFQMLYGIRRELQEELVKEGYPVRIYVPYGTQWYPYFMRRLAERPANLWFFVSSLIRR